MFWGTDLVGYCKCNMEGLCLVMLLSCNTAQLQCTTDTGSEFFVQGIKVPECLSAPGPLSVYGTGGKVDSV